MKNIVIVLILVAAAVYFFFIHGGPLKKEFTLNGETFAYSKHMYGGAIDNHFYTPDGVDFNVATSFVQVLEFDDEIPKNDWLNRLRPLLNRYQLKPLGDEDLEMAGKGNMSGFFFKSYAAPIHVADDEHFAIYIKGSSENLEEDSEYERDERIDELKHIVFE